MYVFAALQSAVMCTLLCAHRLPRRTHNTVRYQNTVMPPDSAEQKIIHVVGFLPIADMTPSDKFVNKLVKKPCSPIQPLRPSRSEYALLFAGIVLFFLRHRW